MTEEVNSTIGDKIKKFFDIRNIIIASLVIIALVFGYMWLFSGDSSSKKRVKELEKENKILEHKEDSLTKHTNYLEEQFNILKLKEVRLEKEISSLEDQIKKSESIANQSKQQLDSLRKELFETKKKIDDLKNNPVNRVGNDLLESIKNKTK